MADPTRKELVKYAKHIVNVCPNGMDKEVARAYLALLDESDKLSAAVYNLFVKHFRYSWTEIA